MEAKKYDGSIAIHSTTGAEIDISAIGLFSPLAAIPIIGVLVQRSRSHFFQRQGYEIPGTKYPLEPNTRGSEVQAIDRQI